MRVYKHIHGKGYQIIKSFMDSFPPIPLLHTGKRCICAVSISTNVSGSSSLHGHVINIATFYNGGVL